MASLVNEKTGLKRIDFIGADGIRRKVRLGRCSKHDATKVKSQIEAITTATITGGSPPAEVSHWLARIDDGMHAKLSAVGLVPPRQSDTLKPFLDKYLAAQTHLKPRSVVKLRHTAEKLLAFFPHTQPLRKITADEASDFRAYLVRLELSQATVKIHSGNVKTIFNDAMRRSLVDKNPFAHLASGVTAAKNEFYVTPELAEKIIAACAQPAYRMTFALARYAGLRINSESSLLEWGDINWERGTMRVRSPKTERHKGHAERIVPIAPRLMTLLEKAFDDAPEGQPKVITGGASSGTAHSYIKKIIAACGLAPWEDLFQTLRRSCEIEWAMTLPQFAVSKWIGHSIAVSGKHYANLIPEETFGRVSGKHAAHNTAQLSREVVRSSGDSGENETGQSAFLSEKAGFKGEDTWRRRESNPSLTQKKPLTSARSEKCGAESGAVGPAPLSDAEWAELQDAMRRVAEGE